MVETYLLDKEFLELLDLQQHRETFARITALTKAGEPLELIQGKITQGSINIDGNSSVRRTCNLTLVTNQIDINNFYWGIKTQFKLEVGLLNQINSKYPDVIWFPQGYFLVSTFNTSIGTNNKTITISGKDKMCMLNGDLGGNLPAPIDFGKEEFLQDTYIEKEIKTNKDYTSHTYYYLNGYEEYRGHFNPELEYYTRSGSSYSKVTISRFNYGTKYYIKRYSLDKGAYNSSRKYYIKEQVTKKTSIPLQDIIREMVHAWCGEPYHNIIINDLNTFGLEQLTFNNEGYNMICLRPVNGAEFSNAIMIPAEESQDEQYYVQLPGQSRQIVRLNKFIKDNPQYFLIGTEDFIQQSNKDLAKVAFVNGNSAPSQWYHAMLLTNGDDVGYRICELVYAGELIANPNETCTSILDKIAKMLGDFEYFYNLDGQFVFQRKPIYTEIAWNSLTTKEGEVQTAPTELASPVVYNFIGNKTITQINNNPVLNNAKNDFSVWGQKKVNDIETPIHIRYAIDKKPFSYKNFDGKIFVSKDSLDRYNLLLVNAGLSRINTNASNVYLVDWREIIYQMALDYFKYSSSDVFVAANNLPMKVLYNSFVAENNPLLYPSGITGYESYYTDMQGFWRELYNPGFAWEGHVADAAGIQYNQLDKGLYLDEQTYLPNSPYYSIQEVWKSGQERDAFLDFYQLKSVIDPNGNFTSIPSVSNYLLTNVNDTKLYWHKDVFNAPDKLHFWIDFLDDDTELSSISKSTIGNRSKVVKDTKITSIYFKQVPGFIFTADNLTAEQRLDKNAYTFISIPKSAEQLFTMSYRGKSGLDELNSLLYKFSYCAENISITTLPIYHLSPNTRIYVEDVETGINGEYIMTKFTIPLTHNGTMSITANKAPTRII